MVRQWFLMTLLCIATSNTVFTNMIINTPWGGTLEWSNGAIEATSITGSWGVSLHSGKNFLKKGAMRQK